MKIKFISDTVIDIYVKKELIGDVNLRNKEELEKYLKKLFKNLKEKYDMEIIGSYDITVYIDKYYGILLRLEKDSFDYYDYFKNQIDMRIIIKDIEFMYEIDDVIPILSNKTKLCIRNNTIYLKIERELNKLEMMELLENSKISVEKN